MKISCATRDELKTVAERDGLSLDAALQKLLRAERQRQMGRELAERLVNEEDRQWIAGSNAAVARAIG